MKNLKEIREKRRQTQLSLSIEIGVQQETISAYENGKAMPAADTLIKLCKHFNCSADYLLDLTTIKTPVKDLIIDNLNTEESELIAKYRAMDAKNKNKVIGYFAALEI